MASCHFILNESNYDIITVYSTFLWSDFNRYELPAIVEKWPIYDDDGYYVYIRYSGYNTRKLFCVIIWHKNEHRALILYGEKFNTYKKTIEIFDVVIKLIREYKYDYSTHIQLYAPFTEYTDKMNEE